jgi:hypothetical protein
MYVTDEQTVSIIITGLCCILQKRNVSCDIYIHVQPCKHCQIDNTHGVTVLVNKMAPDQPKMSVHQAFAMTTQTRYSSSSPRSPQVDAESERHILTLPLASTPEFVLISSMSISTP